MWAQSFNSMHKSLLILVCNSNFVKLKRDQHDLSYQKKKSLFSSYACMGFGGRFWALEYYAAEHSVTSQITVQYPLDCIRNSNTWSYVPPQTPNNHATWFLTNLSKIEFHALAHNIGTGREYGVQFWPSFDTRHWVIDTFVRYLDRFFWTDFWTNF